MPPIFRWFQAQDYNIREYGKSGAVHLYKVHIPESFTCTKTNCSNRWHICNIDNLFDDMHNVVWVSNLETISTCKKTLCQDYIVPGWNDYVKEASTEARNCYILWFDMGKHGPICELMRKTRLHFKYLLKLCQQREDKARADTMAKSMHTIQLLFGKTSKSYKKAIPNAFPGANNPPSISVIWKTHFESLLNNVTTDVNMQNVKECVNNTWNVCNDNDTHITSWNVCNDNDTHITSWNVCNDNDTHITSWNVCNDNDTHITSWNVCNDNDTHITSWNVCNDNDTHITSCVVQNAIDKLKSGKAFGNDGLSAEHFIHADT